MKNLLLILLLTPLLAQAEPTSICKDEIIQARSKGDIQQALKISEKCCTESKDAYG